MDGVMKLISVWSPDWICHHEALAGIESECKTIYLVHAAQISFFTAEGKSAPVDLILKLTKLSQPSLKPLLVRLTPPSEKEFTWYLAESSEGNPRRLYSIPTTLRTFAAWWKALGAERYRFVHVMTISTGCKFDESPDEYTCEVIDLRRLGQREKAILGDLDNLPRSAEARTYFDLMVGGIPEQIRLSALIDGYGTKTNVELRVAGYLEGRVSQSDVLDLFPGSPEGDLETSFSDLYQATAGVQSLEFDRILDYLDTNNTNSSEVFEIFGLKMPAGQVTGWGTGVILCIQLYLFVYLRDLKRPLEPRDDAWNVGWFGAKEALIPRAIFFVTVWILPTLTVVLLAKHPLEQRLELTPFRFHQGAGTIREFFAFVHDFPAVWFMALGCSLSLLLGWLNWFNRPCVRVETGSSRSQLFE